MKYLFFLSFNFVLFLNCFSQESDDINILKELFSCDTFYITEEFHGNNGGHIDHYEFIKKNNFVKIIYSTEMLEKAKTLGKVKISLNELAAIEKIFLNCIINHKRNENDEFCDYKFTSNSVLYTVENASTDGMQELNKWKKHTFRIR